MISGGTFPVFPDADFFPCSHIGIIIGPGNADQLTARAWSEIKTSAKKLQGQFTGFV